MNVVERKIRNLQLSDSSNPFNDWFQSLRDKRLCAAVDARLAQVRSGNFGDFRSLGDGVFELRIHKGPGIRVYYGILNQEVVILLGGGKKGTQKKDITKAKKLWKGFRNEIKKI